MCVRALDAAVAAYARGLGVAESGAYTWRAEEGQRAAAASARITQALAREFRVLVVCMFLYGGGGGGRKFLELTQVTHPVAARTQTTRLGSWRHSVPACVISRITCRHYRCRRSLRLRLVLCSRRTFVSWPLCDR
jgi:hypothetical protein